MYRNACRKIPRLSLKPSIVRVDGGGDRSERQIFVCCVHSHHLKDWFLAHNTQSYKHVLSGQWSEVALINLSWPRLAVQCCTPPPGGFLVPCFAKMGCPEISRLLTYLPKYTTLSNMVEGRLHSICCIQILFQTTGLCFCLLDEDEATTGGLSSLIFYWILCSPGIFSFVLYPSPVFSMTLAVLLHTYCSSDDKFPLFYSLIIFIACRQEKDKYIFFLKIITTPLSLLWSFCNASLSLETILGLYGYTSQFYRDYKYKSYIDR